jgi:hypothetical protein
MLIPSPRSAMAAEHIAFVLKGQKRATTSLVRDYASHGRTTGSMASGELKLALLILGETGVCRYEFRREFREDVHAARFGGRQVHKASRSLPIGNDFYPRAATIGVLNCFNNSCPVT